LWSSWRRSPCHARLACRRCPGCRGGGEPACTRSHGARTVPSGGVRASRHALDRMAREGCRPAACEIGRVRG
jgi:hypothetical protein